MKRFTPILITVSCAAFYLLGHWTHAAPLGTAFTYQGRLDQNGLPAPNGTYQMTFWLYGASSGGNPLASNTVPTIPVTNGLFAADVDFDANWFTGDERWTAITVRTNNNAASFVLLSPRTRLAPTPNAIYASTAGTVTNGGIQAAQLKTTNTPSPGQILGYDGSSMSMVWQNAGATSPFLFNGTSAYYNGGSVGIGTLNPLKSLQVGDDSVPGSEGMIRFGSRAPTGNSQRSWNIGVPQTDADLSGIGYSFVIDDTGLGSGPEFMIKWGSGRVGIGTLSPLKSLQVGDDSVAGSEGMIRFGSRAPTGNSLRSWNIGVPQTGADLSGIGYSFVIDDTYAGTGPEFMIKYGSGNVGIGTTTPESKLFISSPASALADASQLSISHGGSKAFSLSLGYFYDPGVQAAGVIQALDAGPTSLLLNPSGGNVGIGTANPQAKLDVGGNARVCTLTIYGGCDLAEPFPMKEEEIEKGSVVVIDEERPGRLKLSMRAYDTQVAGIVSGANGISAGIALKQEGALDQGQNVALTGRVYVQADASFGAIKPGDLLTTSDTPGHAMKVTDHARAQGAILGKAMSALAEGKGLVLVLVTLQ
jgi:hypothetical protein